MKIYLYKCIAEKNRVDKSAFLSSYLSLEGDLRAPSSIVNPIFTIESSSPIPDTLIVGYNNGYVDIVDDEEKDVGFSENEEDVSNLLFCNYAYIPAFRRYYFVSDVTAITSKLFQLTLNVDVLMSFKDEILMNTALIARNENDYSPLITDSRRNFYAVRDVYIDVPTDGALKNLTFSTTNLSENIVITTQVIGTNIINFSNIPAPTGSGLPEIHTRYFSNANAGRPYAVGASDLANFQKFVMKDTDVQSFVTGVYAYPFNIPLGLNPTPHDILIGEKTANDMGTPPTNIQGYYPIYLNLSGYLVLADFTLSSATSFKDYAPYTTYEFYIPFLGYVAMDNEKILGKHILVYYSVQYSTGESNVFVYSVTDGCELYSSTCNLGVNVPLFTSDINDYYTRKDLNYVNMLTSVFSQGAGLFGGVAGGIVKQDYLGTITGGVSRASSLVNTIESYPLQQALLHPHGNVTSSGGTTSLYNPLAFHIKRSVVREINDSGFASLNGYPLNDSRVLSTLSGYTEVAQVHLEHCGEALSGEQNEIVNLLRSGVII